MAKIEIRVKNFDHKFIMKKIIHRKLKEKNVWIALAEIAMEMGLVFQSWSIENDVYIINCINSIDPSSGEYYSRVNNL